MTRIVARSRQNGAPIPRFWTVGRERDAEWRTVRVPLEAIERLRPFARRRGITTNELLRRLVDAALDDGIVDAVLDDMEA